MGEGINMGEARIFPLLTPPPQKKNFNCFLCPLCKIITIIRIAWECAQNIMRGRGVTGDRRRGGINLLGETGSAGGGEGCVCVCQW